MDSDFDAPKPPAELRSANENPWYILATLHGEQGSAADPSAFDQELHDKNRYYWNRYIASLISKETLAAVPRKANGDSVSGIPGIELTPIGSDELPDFMRRFQTRSSLVNFPKGVQDFSKTHFDKPFFADGFVFGTAKFETAHFCGRAKFNGSVFTEEIEFDSATFSLPADFARATFLKSAFFGGSKFLGAVSFKGVEFLGYAGFILARFDWVADFAETAFSAVANFSEATFAHQVAFNFATFSGSTIFNKTTFFNRSFFQGAQFTNTISFAKARFKRFPPNFNGVPTLFEGTIWPDENGWPAARSNKDDARYNLLCYERLKKDAEIHKKHRQELFFFAKELECQQAIDGPWKGLPLRLYSIFSDYGRSTTRPFLALLVLFFIGGVINENLSVVSTTSAWGFSAASLLDILGARKNFFEEFMIEANGIVAVYSTLQTGFGILLAFLIGLALRNRFRMK